MVYSQGRTLSKQPAADTAQGIDCEMQCTAQHTKRCDELCTAPWLSTVWMCAASPRR